jgi:hypothetical protein
MGNDWVKIADFGMVNRRSSDSYRYGYKTERHRLAIKRRLATRPVKRRLI